MLRKRLLRTLLLASGGGGAAAPAPIEFTDDFARADGAVGNDWTGAAWAIAGGKVGLSSPTLSDELLTNGNMETWLSATNLDWWMEGIAGTSTVNQDGDDKHGGSYSCRMDVDGSGSNAYLYKALAVGADNKWLLLDFWTKSVGTKYIWPFIDSMYAVVPTDDLLKPGAEWTHYYVNIRAGVALRQLRLFKGNQASESAWWDDISTKTLTEAEMMLTRPEYPTADYVIEVDITDHTIGTLGGVVFGLDDPTNPLNYAVLWFSGKTGIIYLRKSVAGVMSAVVNSDKNSFAVGSTIRIAKLDAAVRVYVDDVVKIDTQTLTDAAIIAGKYAGIFSGYTGNLFDNWTESVRAVGGSTDFLTPYFNNLFVTGIGDSITAAASDEEVTGGHVGILVTDLMDERDEYVALVPDKLAVGGWTLLQVHAGLAAWIGAAKGAPSYILFEIGANDITDNYWGAEGYTEAAWKTTLAADLDAIHAAWSTTRIYLSKTYRQGVTELSRIDTLYGWQQAVIADGRSGWCFEGIDNVPIFDGHPELMDGGVLGVHPNHAGYVAKAAAWKALLGY